jgi:predicted RNA binding protein YcfA (HicA-like mRNA interferase family)
LPELPVLSGKEARSAFERAGWIFRRQSVSHMILTRPGSMVSLAIPDHRELAAGTLRKLIRISGLTVDQFRSLLG